MPLPPTLMPDTPAVTIDTLRGIVADHYRRRNEHQTASHGHFHTAARRERAGMIPTADWHLARAAHHHIAAVLARTVALTAETALSVTELPAFPAAVRAVAAAIDAYGIHADTPDDGDTLGPTR